MLEAILLGKLLRCYNHSLELRAFVMHGICLGKDKSHLRGPRGCIIQSSILNSVFDCHQHPVRKAAKCEPVYIREDLLPLLQFGSRKQFWAFAGVICEL